MTGVYYKRENDSHHLVFRCEVEGAWEPHPSSDEISACGWFSRGELPRPMTDFTLRRIDDALAGALPDGVLTIAAMRLLE